MMNFEEAYKKVAEGTASVEEAAYVAQEIVKAQKVQSILDDDAPKKAVLEEADAETVAKARKSFNMKNTIKIIVIAVLLILLAGGTVTAFILGTEKSSADKTARMDEQQAIELAQQTVQEYDPSVDTSKCIVKDIDKHLNTSDGISRAVRIYEIELEYGLKEYEVRVNAATGEAMVTDIDY